MLLLAGGCAFSPPSAASEPGPPPDPIAFFAGSSHGEGEVTTLFGSRRRVHVTSVGVAQPDGGLTLDQRIAMDGKAARERRWTMRPVGDGRWTGTLTDADGPVEVSAQGAALRIAYRMPNGMAVDQWLVAGPPRTLRNRMTIRKAGIIVARLDEVIRKD